MILTDHIYAVLKHFYSDGSDLFQDDLAPRAQELTERFNECKNYANQVLWPSRSPTLNPVKYLRGDFGPMFEALF